MVYGREYTSCPVLSGPQRDSATAATTALPGSSAHTNPGALYIFRSAEIQDSLSAVSARLSDCTDCSLGASVLWPLSTNLVASMEQFGLSLLTAADGMTIHRWSRPATFAPAGHQVSVPWGLLQGFVMH